MYTMTTTADRLEAYADGKWALTGAGYVERVTVERDAVDGDTVAVTVTDGPRGSVMLEPAARVEIIGAYDALTAAGYAVQLDGRAQTVHTVRDTTTGAGGIEVTTTDYRRMPILELGSGVTVADIVAHAGDLNDYVMPAAHTAGYRIAAIVPAVVGYVEIPAGTVMHRGDYIPANQSSRHEIRGGLYPVELTRRGSVISAGDRPDGYRVELTATAGTHNYYAAASTSTDLGAHTLTLTGYAYQLDAGTVPVEIDGKWQRLEIIPAARVARAYGVAAPALIVEGVPA